MMQIFRLTRFAGLLSIAAGLTLSAIRARSAATATLHGGGSGDRSCFYLHCNPRKSNGRRAVLVAGRRSGDKRAVLSRPRPGGQRHRNARQRQQDSAARDLVTIVFGPSYTFHRGKRVSVFGRALLGEAHGLNSVFSYGSGPLPSLSARTTDSANAYALQTGGGVNFRVSPHLAVRAVEVITCARNCLMAAPTSRTLFASPQDW